MNKKKERMEEIKRGTYPTDAYLESERVIMPLTETYGEIKISDEVVVAISAIAASKVSGVHSIGGKTLFGKKDIEKGINATVEGNQAIIDVDVKIDYGENIYDTVQRLQKQIKDAVEQMTGLQVAKVNVTVKGVVMPEGGFRPKDFGEERK
ncbi:MAG: Asp23/Gls24 family envelope stress response protein [Candidatus Sumerlaeia bacterium]|nr:Asp23/Gls24 family envelope stress response protein [Candidatus Sumerlaeia bacterium]